MPIARLQVDSLLGPRAREQWSQLLQPEPLFFCVPGVLIGLAILILVMRYRHFLVLPSLLLAVPLLFYLVMGVFLGFSLQEMRDFGLVAQAEPSGNPLLVWHNFDLGLVKWSLVPGALPTWFGMYIVVAFSSSLDVAAIQVMACGLPRRRRQSRLQPPARHVPIAPDCSRLLPIAPDCSRLLPIAPGCSRLLPVAPVALDCSRSLPVASACS